jgi:hypothetical protein
VSGVSVRLVNIIKRKFFACKLFFSRIILNKFKEEEEEEKKPKTINLKSLYCK